MRRGERLFRYGIYPLAVGLAELVADGFLPSSAGVTNPIEEITEGFLVAEAGVVAGVMLYRAICRRRGRVVNTQEETGYAILGGVIGLIGMTATGLVLHQVLGVSDISWWPR